MWFFLLKLEYLNGCVIDFKIHQDSCFCTVMWFGGFWFLVKCCLLRREFSGSMRRVYQLMRFLEFSSMLGMQLKIIVRHEMHDFAKFVFGFCDFLETGHDWARSYLSSCLHQFFVYSNFGMWVGTGSGGVSTIGVQNKNLFMRGSSVV